MNVSTTNYSHRSLIQIPLANECEVQLPNPVSGRTHSNHSMVSYSERDGSMCGEPLANTCIDHSSTPLKLERTTLRKGLELSICSKPLPGQTDSLGPLPCWLCFQQTTEWEGPEEKKGNVTESRVASWTLEVTWREHMPHFTVLGLPLVHACYQAFCFGICTPPCSFLCGMNHVFMKNNSLITAPHLLFKQRLSVLLKRNTFLKDAIHSPTRKFMISAFASLAGALEADSDRHQQKCLDVVITVTFHGEIEQPQPPAWALGCPL